MAFAVAHSPMHAANWAIYMATIRIDYVLNLDSLYTATHVALSPVSRRYRIEARVGRDAAQLCRIKTPS
jgi:hypothetical protein